MGSKGGTVMNSACSGKKNLKILLLEEIVIYFPWKMQA
jgi:hypothetical protein